MGEIVGLVEDLVSDQDPQNELYLDDPAKELHLGDLESWVHFGDLKCGFYQDDSRGSKPIDVVLCWMVLDES